MIMIKALLTVMMVHRRNLSMLPLLQGSRRCGGFSLLTSSDARLGSRTPDWLQGMSLADKLPQPGAVLVSRDHQQSAAFSKVQASVCELQSFRRVDEHLPRSVATKLQKLIRAAHDPVAEAAARDAQPEWRALRQPQTAAASPTPGRAQKAAARTTLRNPCAASWTASAHRGADASASAPFETVTDASAHQAYPRPPQSRSHGHSIMTEQRAQRPHPQHTLVVDQIAHWRRRSDVCACRKSGRQLQRAHRQVVYALMHRARSCTGCVRYTDLAGVVHFCMGTVAHNYDEGFGVAHTPQAALECTPRQRLHDGGVVVVRGIANGVGYLDKGLVFVPSFKPVCEVDLVVTGA